eukprot:16635-Chlamydomonas_euryale.AAC.1
MVDPSMGGAGWEPSGGEGGHCATLWTDGGPVHGGRRLGAPGWEPSGGEGGHRATLWTDGGPVHVVWAGRLDCHTCAAAQATQTTDS